MRLPSFEYRVAASVEEAVALAAEVPGTSFLAGGTDLLPQMRLGRKTPARTVELKRIPRLDRILETEDGGLEIGATATLTAIAMHPRVRTDYPLLVDCCLAVGAWPLRNRATLAGNICNASPAADTAVALLALDASVWVVGPAGSRNLAISDFFLGPGKSAIEPGEMVVSVAIPGASAGRRGRYLRLSRRQGMDLATVGVLVALPGASSGHRIALCAVYPTPLRVTEAEALLDNGGSPAEAAEIARQASRPITDLRGTAEYRREMVGVLVQRGLLDLRRAS